MAEAAYTEREIALATGKIKLLEHGGRPARGGSAPQLGQRWLAAIPRPARNAASRDRAGHARLGRFRASVLGPRTTRHRHHHRSAARRVEYRRREARRLRPRRLHRRGVGHHEPIAPRRAGAGGRGRPATERGRDSRSDDALAQQVPRSELPRRRELYERGRRGALRRCARLMGFLPRDDRARHLEALHVQPQARAAARRHDATDASGVGRKTTR